MKKYIPKAYYPNILAIDYKKLKDQGIKCLIFDLDNTIALIDEKCCPKTTKDLLLNLKKDFTIVISSNNIKKRVLKYALELDVDYCSLALKPLTKSLRQIRKKYHFNKNEMVLIGDQLMTDIKCGNSYGIKTILVDPLGVKDLKVTSINRFFEEKILKKFKQDKILERRKYYD